MKYLFLNVYLLVVCVLMSFNESPKRSTAYLVEKKIEVLPFKKFNLDGLTDFKPVSKNWQIVGKTFVDLTQKQTFVSEPGTGILLNIPGKGMSGNIFTAFEHSDIEIELDVMMPVQSNSGLYFQGRYEIQLFDSWAVSKPKYADIGGVYQRFDNSKLPKGYEGKAPRINAAKAPGLWQHFRIVFQAPRFNAEGIKTKNAIFKEVFLNGFLIHENQEVTGPTQGSAFNDEKPMGPFMIQGDHGAVAFRNIQCKLYEQNKVSFNSVSMKEFENSAKFIPDYNKLEKLREINTDTVSADMVTGRDSQKLLVFNGLMNVPTTGDYLFEMKINGGGGALLLKTDTIVNLNGDFKNEEPAFKLVTLQKGFIPFTLIYNKHQKFRLGFSLFVEGPGIARHTLHTAPPVNIAPVKKIDSAFVIDASNETVLQRGFLMHNKIKRTHTISVGSPKNIHYSFDLAFGSLIQVWGGKFLEVSEMWAGRGIQQLGVPLGIPVLLHGDPDFAFLENKNSNWPDSIPSGTVYKQLGYELDNYGNPTFSTLLNGSTITNSFVPIDSLRRLKRIILTKSIKEIWHKLADGSIIEKLPNGVYAIDDRNYFLDFSTDNNNTPVIRKSSGKDELLVKIPAGNQKITYTITW